MKTATYSTPQNAESIISFKTSYNQNKSRGLIGVCAITLWIIHNMLWKYLYNWLSSMAAINSCPPLSGLNDLVRGHTSPDALYEINTTSPLELNRPSVPFVHEVWCRGIIILSLKVLKGPTCPLPPADLQLCSGRPKLLFDPFSSLIYVKPALNVRTVFACQCGSVCSSLFSDVDSLIACKFSPLC